MQSFELVRNAQAIFLDWDGCVFENGALKPGAFEFLSTYKDKTTILSNASALLGKHVARKLALAGLSFPPERVLLAGETALAHACSRFGAEPLLILGARVMRRHAAKLGLRLADSDVAAVVLLRDTDFSYARLRTAANAIRDGASLIVANPDLTHPSGRQINPETGALLAALNACTDLRTVDVTYVGKPYAPMFERALVLNSCAPANAVMIGDNPTTDIEGAQRMGLPSILLEEAAGVTLAALIAGKAAASQHAAA